MTYPQPPGGWTDPSRSQPQQSPTGYPETTPQPAYGYPTPTQPSSGQPAGYPDPTYPPYGYQYGYAPAPQTNSLAIAALVLSLVGVASCITAPIGAILGHVASKQIRERGEGGAGMAKAAIIVGWILTGLLLLLVAFYIIVIVFAVSNSSGFDSGF